MLRRTLRSAVAVRAAGGILLLSLAASAQDKGEGQKPPDQTQGGENPDNKGEAEQKAAEQAKAAEAKALKEYKDAVANLPSSAGAAECVWTGRRVASLLWRDDIDTARRYIDLYDRFGCSSEHLKLVFRCVILQGPLDPKAADRLASRVHDCWITPEEATTTSSQATTSSPPKNGTIPN